MKNKHCDIWDIGLSRIKQGDDFLCIFTIAFDILGYFKVGDCPAGLKNGPTELEFPTGAINRRKATLKT